MNIIYVVFGLTIGIGVVINFLYADKKEKIQLSSVHWLLIGMAYFVMFIILAATNKVSMTNIYVFQVVSTIGIVWFSRALEFRFLFMSLPIAIGISVFTTCWTVIAYVREVSAFSILFPSTLSMTLITFVIGIYFFIRSDDELLLKNVLGGLFTAFGLCKMLYIIDDQGQDMNFYINLFILDYLIYIIMTFLLFFNNSYRYENKKNRHFIAMKEVINEAPIGYVTLDKEGKIITSNTFISKRLADAGIGEGTIYDLFDSFNIIDKFYYQTEWKKILVALDMRQRYYKSKEIYDEKKIDVQFDFHQVEIYSLNNPVILLNIFYRESELMGLEFDSSNDFTDRITGLPTKSDMEKIFSRRIQNDRDGSFAVILMSIANYREMVRYVGSEMAEDFMSIINTYIEEVDQIESIGKISSDTFELFTKGLEADQIGEVVNDLILNLQIPFEHKEYDVETKPLLGIALYPMDGVSHGELMRSARIALAKAESTPTAQIQYSDSRYMTNTLERLYLEEQLKTALENEEFYLVFQPQYDTTNKIFRGFEALIRWENGEKERNVISPNLFIPIVEEMGIIDEIGQWILNEAIGKAASWQKKYDQKFIISINISETQLEQGGLAFYIGQLLEAYDYEAKYLELEVAESNLLTSSSNAMKELRALKDMGLKIAIDDFGTGYSSLDYLRWLPFDVLKIDKSFIDYLNDDSVEREIVHSVINIVNKMNLETIAEGVENSEQLKSLKASNCTYIQGYLFSEPLSDEDVESVLAKNNY